MAFDVHPLARKFIFPQFYFFGNRHMKSDRPFIEKCLQFMSDDNKRMASDHYRELYLREGRKAANFFLADFAKKYGVSREEYEEARVEAGGLNQKFRDKIEELKKMKRGRVSILSMAEATVPAKNDDGLTHGLRAKRRRKQWGSILK